MGKYINRTSNGIGLSVLDKVGRLLKDGAVLAEKPVKFQENLVCVVDNGFFEAAGYCYNEREFEEFNDSSDPRMKTWLVYPHAKELAD